MVTAQTLTTDCSGTRDGDTVTLTFDGSVGSSVQLLLDGSWLRTVTDLTSATDHSPVGGTYVLRLRQAGEVVDVSCDVKEDAGGGGVDPEPPVDPEPLFVRSILLSTTNRSTWCCLR